MRAFVALMFSSVLALGCGKVSSPGTGRDAAAAASETIELGHSKMLRKDVRYALAGSDIVVVNRGASMASVLIDNDPNKESSVFSLRLEISSKGKTQAVTLSSTQPLVTLGYRFSADPVGFEYGRADGAVVIERAP